MSKPLVQTQRWHKWSWGCMRSPSLYDFPSKSHIANFVEFSPENTTRIMLIKSSAKATSQKLSYHKQHRSSNIRRWNTVSNSLARDAAQSFRRNFSERRWTYSRHSCRAQYRIPSTEKRRRCRPPWRCFLCSNISSYPETRGVYNRSCYLWRRENINFHNSTIEAASINLSHTNPTHLWGQHSPSFFTGLQPSSS